MSDSHSSDRRDSNASNKSTRSNKSNSGGGGGVSGGTTSQLHHAQRSSTSTVRPKCGVRVLI